jgi:DNA-binding XRE family transcriptional regulator
MTPAEKYKTARKLIGTQKEVAKMLGIDRVTVAKRETGVLQISRESELALAAIRSELPPRAPLIGERNSHI